MEVRFNETARFGDVAPGRVFQWWRGNEIGTAMKLAPYSYPENAVVLASAESRSVGKLVIIVDDERVLLLRDVFLSADQDAQHTTLRVDGNSEPGELEIWGAEAFLHVRVPNNDSREDELVNLSTGESLEGRGKPRRDERSYPAIIKKWTLVQGVEPQRVTLLSWPVKPV